MTCHQAKTKHVIDLKLIEKENEYSKKYIHAHRLFFLFGRMELKLLEQVANQTEVLSSNLTIVPTFIIIIHLVQIGPQVRKC